MIRNALLVSKDWLTLYLEGVGKFYGDVSLVKVRQLGNFPVEPGIATFIKYHIEIGPLFGIVSEADVGQDLVYGAVVLHKS